MADGIFHDLSKADVKSLIKNLMLISGSLTGASILAGGGLHLLEKGISNVYSKQKAFKAMMDLDNYLHQHNIFSGTESAKPLSATPEAAKIAFDNLWKLNSKLMAVPLYARNAVMLALEHPEGGSLQTLMEQAKLAPSNEHIRRLVDLHSKLLGTVAATTLHGGS